MTTEKRINGKRYEHHDSSQYKSEAWSSARYLRKRGYSARVYKEKPSKQSGWRNAYVVYKRKK